MALTFGDPSVAICESHDMAGSGEEEEAAIAAAGAGTSNDVGPAEKRAPMGRPGLLRAPALKSQNMLRVEKNKQFWHETRHIAMEASLRQPGFAAFGLGDTPIMQMLMQLFIKLKAGATLAHPVAVVGVHGVT